MSGIYQRKTNSATAKNPNSNQTLISVDETGKIFTKDSSGNVTVYPTTGGGGSFTGGTVTGEAIFTNGLSANTMSSSTLNVNYSDTFTFNVGNTFSQSYFEYFSAFGDWVEFQFTGSNIGSKLDFTNNEIYNAIQVGNSSIPGVGSVPLAQAGQTLTVNDGIISGSTLNNGFIVTDQTGLGGDVIIQNVISSVINNTLSGSNISYNVGTEFEQNNESSNLVFSKTNEAGEAIQLNINSDSSGVYVYSELTDADAEIFGIIDGEDDFRYLFQVNKGGPNITSFEYGFQIAQPSSAFTESLFSVRDVDDNILFSVTSGSTTFDSTLPTSAAGLIAGQVYTQTAAELGGSGSTKVLCIV